MSVEFSGHSTNAGGAVSPASTRAASAAGRGDVVVEHGAALGEGVHALPRHVALDGGHPDLPGRGEGRPAPRRRARPPGPPGRGGHGGTAQASSGRAEQPARPAPVPSRATTNEVPAGADPGQQRRERGVDGGEGQPAPGEAAPGHRRAQRVDGDPGGRGPQRPARQPPDAGQGHAQQAVEGRLQDRQADPGVHPDDREPRHEHAHERSAVRQADEDRPSAAQAAHREGEPERRPARAARTRANGSNAAAAAAPLRAAAEVRSARFTDAPRVGPGEGGSGLRRRARAARPTYPAGPGRREGPAPFGPTTLRPAA